MVVKPGRNSNLNFILLSLIGMVLSVTSYNSQGLGPDRLDYITDLCKVHDICLIQETWILNDNLNLIQESVPGINSHGVSGIDDSTLLIGRPHGGCSILWKKSLLCEATPVSGFESKRICAVKFKFSDNVCILVVNVYMPCDFIPANLPEYRAILDEVASAVVSTGVDQIIFGGDFNTDIVRNSQNTRCLGTFLDSEHLVNCLSFPLASVPYTFESKINGHKSILDHVMVSENMVPFIEGYTSLHDGNNMSDHCPVSVRLNIETNRQSGVNRVRQVTQTDEIKISWHNANANHLLQYKNSLDNLLGAIEVPVDLMCNNLHCRNHSRSINELYVRIIQACIEAGQRHLPKTKGSARVNCIPGWNEAVADDKQRAIFWHNLWKSNGSPREGVVADVRRRTRAQYHLAVRQAKLNSERYKATKIADSLLKNDKADFWSEVRKMNKSSQKLPNMVDGISGEEMIGDLFAKKYANLYNSVSYDKQVMTSIFHDINRLISTNCSCETSSCDRQHFTTVADIVSHVKLLNFNKNDGLLGLSTNHLKHGTHRLYTLLSVLLTAMIRHGHIPDDMLISTIVPIPKNAKKSVNDSSNYRAIALNSPICKLLETVILSKAKDELKSSDMQFGYKKGLSTTSCTFAVNETIKYYLNGGSNVYAMLLDASQAFDRVEYTRLFRLLIKKNVCPTLARMIAILYTKQQMRVRWCSHNSYLFSVTNGVKQGGILSPALFSIYIDVLLERLQDSGQGCYVGSIFAGAYGYADDIIILCPSKLSLSSQLNVAISYSNEYLVLFNAVKCHLLHFMPDRPNIGDAPPTIVFQGTHIVAEGSAVHLGHLIGPQVKNAEVTKSVSDFNRRVNVLLSKFHFCKIETKIRLFNTYCMSLYGCVIWDFDDRSIETFYVAWRKAVRRVLGLHPMTHCRLLSNIMGCPPIEVTLKRRFLNFLNRTLHHTNVLTSLACRLSIDGSASSVSNTINNIATYLNIPRHSVQQRTANEITATPVDIETTRVAALVRDFIILREENPAEAVQMTFIINHLCVAM